MAKLLRRGACLVAVYLVLLACTAHLCRASSRTLCASTLVLSLCHCSWTIFEQFYRRSPWRGTVATCSWDFRLRRSPCCMQVQAGLLRARSARRCITLRNSTVAFYACLLQQGVAATADDNSQGLQVSMIILHALGPIRAPAEFGVKTQTASV